jgi:hypothetical protein
MKVLFLVIAALTILVASLSAYIYHAVDQGCMDQCLKSGYTYGYCYAKCTY